MDLDREYQPAKVTRRQVMEMDVNGRKPIQRGVCDKEGVAATPDEDEHYIYAWPSNAAFLPVLTVYSRVPLLTKSDPQRPGRLMAASILAVRGPDEGREQSP